MSTPFSVTLVETGKHCLIISISNNVYTIFKLDRQWALFMVMISQAKAFHGPNILCLTHVQMNCPLPIIWGTPWAPFILWQLPRLTWASVSISVKKEQQVSGVCLDGFCLACRSLWFWSLSWRRRKINRKRMRWERKTMGKKNSVIWNLNASGLEMLFLSSAMLSH